MLKKGEFKDAGEEEAISSLLPVWDVTFYSVHPVLKYIPHASLC